MQRKHLSIIYLNKFYPQGRSAINDTLVHEVWQLSNETSFKKVDHFADEVIAPKYFPLQINFRHMVHTTPHEVFHASKCPLKSYCESALCNSGIFPCPSSNKLKVPAAVSYSFTYNSMFTRCQMYHMVVES
jgi:hypothetical protein